MFRIDFAVLGEKNWASNGQRFPNEREADESARARMDRWMLMRGWRVVDEYAPEREPINEADVRREVA